MWCSRSNRSRRIVDDVPATPSDYGYEYLRMREYLEAVAAQAPALSTRLEAFDGLCRFFQPGLRERDRKN